VKGDDIFSASGDKCKSIDTLIAASQLREMSSKFFRYSRQQKTVQALQRCTVVACANGVTESP